MLITLNQYATHHILQTRTDITRNANHTQSCTRSCAGSNVNSHQATQKANQHTDAKPEKHHGQSIQPKVYTGNKQEEAESHHIHQTENQCRNITATTEKLIGDNTRKHRTDNTANRTDGNDETRIKRRITFLRLQIEHTPTIHRISADIHESTAESKYPDSRILQD